MSGKLKKGVVWSGVIRGVLVALCLSLLLTLAIALLSMVTEIPTGVISVVTEVATQIAICIGAFLSIKEGSVGIVNGLFVGIIYAIVAFIIYSIIGGSFIFDQKLGVDIVFATIFGCLGGIIGANANK